MTDNHIIYGLGNSSRRLAATFRQVPVLIESPEVSIIANFHLSTLTIHRLNWIIGHNLTSRQSIIQSFFKIGSKAEGRG